MIPIDDARADGFHDPGLQYAKIRTDYNATNEGTAANPITLVSPCLYPPDDDLPPPPGGPDGIVLVDNQCDQSPSVFSQSNYYQENGGGSSSTFWVLSMNNEPWTNQTINSGPPNQSLPHAWPGYGIMGFNAIIDYAAGENFWRLHKVLNRTLPGAPGGIPFLSVGAVYNRGNGGPIGTINVPNRQYIVTFKDKLWDYNQGAVGTIWVVSHFLIVTAEWGGKQRMLFLHLFYDGMFPDPAHPGQFVPWAGWSAIDDNGTGSSGVNKGWNWQIQESFWYPGADIAYMDAAAMNLPQVCNMNIPTFQYIGQELSYYIDLKQAFRCASDEDHFQSPMPTSSPVSITSVHWAVESYGDVAIWTSVHDMRTRYPICAPFCLQGASNSDPAPPVAILSESINEYPLAEQTTVAEIRAALGTSCGALPGCAEANAWSVPGAPIPDRPPGGVSGTIRELVEFTQHSSSAGG